MYTCNNCNYETTDRTSYYHHTKTKKHLNSINKIFTLTRILNTDMNFVLSVKIIINKLIIQIHGLSRRNLFLLS